MAKYIKLEDVIKTYADSKMCKHIFKKKGLDLVERFFADLPTIEIVHCKDCKWSKPNKQGDYDCKCHIPIFRVPADGWCYLGERIEE